jgi:hypothetical protein
VRAWTGVPQRWSAVGSHGGSTRFPWPIGWAEWDMGYTGFPSVFVVIRTYFLFEGLLLCSDWVEFPEEQADLFAASRTADGLVGLGLDVGCNAVR